MTDENEDTPKTKTKNPYWGRQIDALVGEVSKLAIACDVDVLDPNVVLKAARGDESVCKRKNTPAFKRLHDLLILLFTVGGKTLDRMGQGDFAELAGPVLEKLRELRGGKKA
ncbi:MAG TPA: hypothetical protein VMU03_09855 [Gammaproteobacteria bacterium]|nr:hypothetical protein [Gammaproteobacteria bacterium]